MPTRVTHRPPEQRLTPANCPDPETHQRCWINLDIAVMAGLTTHPEFTCHHAPNGDLEAFSAPMECGCTWLGIPL